MNIEPTRDDLEFLMQYLVNHDEDAPRLFTPILAVAYAVMQEADNVVPMFKKLPLPDLRHGELANALEATANAIAAFDDCGRPALAAAMGQVLDVLILHTKATDDFAGMTWLSDVRFEMRAHAAEIARIQRGE